MKKLSTSIIIIALAVLSACASLDVVGKDSVRAFGDIIDIVPPSGGEETGWSIVAPDGSARFFWSYEEAYMSVDAQPFVSAGLDVSKLDKKIEADLHNIKFYTAKLNSVGSARQQTPLKQFEKDAEYLRGAIGYHMEMDHYNITFGDGSMFEWAKDTKTNDKDIVFVVNAEPLIAAGADPEIEGWLSSNLTIQADGKPKEIRVYLKPFDID